MNGQRQQGQDPYYGMRQLAGTLGQMAQYKQKKEGMANTLAQKWIPQVTLESYPDYQDWAKQLGVSFPLPDLNSQEEFDRWQQGPAEVSDKDRFGPEYWDEKTGQRVQRNLRSGKVTPYYTKSGKGSAALSMNKHKAWDKKQSLARWRQGVAATGGAMNPGVFAMIQKEDPELAALFQGARDPRAMQVMEEYEEYLDSHIYKTKEEKEGRLKAGWKRHQ